MSTSKWAQGAIASLLCLIAVACGDGSAVTAERFAMYFASVNAHRVTVETRAGETARLYLPRGVLLAVEYEDESAAFVDEEPMRFFGNLVIRARNGAEIAPGEGSVSMEIMSLAPFVLTVTGATVVVERLAEQ